MFHEISLKQLNQLESQIAYRPLEITYRHLPQHCSIILCINWRGPMASEAVKADEN